MIKVTKPNPLKSNVNWGTVKHPVLIEAPNRNIYLTVPISYQEEKSIYDWERDCICLISFNNEKVGNKVYKLNLENCALYNQEIIIKNE